MNNLTEEQFNSIQDTHNNEQLWHLFLHYDCPLDEKENQEYVKLFNAVQKALDEYTTYMENHAEIFGTEFNL